MTLSKPPISKEYGAWASILTAFLAGSGVAWQVNLKSSLLFLGALSFFLARMPLLGILRYKFSGKMDDSNFIRYRNWFILYSLTGIILFSILLFKYKLTGLFIFIILSLAVFSYNVRVTHDNGPRSNGASFSGILGISLLSSFTYYTATGHLNSIAAILWILVFLYLAGGILYVRARLGESGWKTCFIFHVVTTVIVVILGMFKFIPILSIIAYCPSFVKSLMGAVCADRETVAKKLGRMELVHSAIFVILVALIYHVGKSPLYPHLIKVGDGGI